MNKIFILGLNQTASRLYTMIQAEGLFEVVGFCAEQSYIHEREFLGLPIVSLEDVPSYVMKNKISNFIGVLNTIGYSKMNSVRQRIFAQYENKITFVTYVSSKAMVDQSAYIGTGSIIFPSVYIGQDCRVDKGVFITSGTVLTHNIEVGQFTFLSSGVTCGGNVKIGNNCFIGLNSTIRNGISIADKTFVGAACYIAHNTEENSVYVQSPAMRRTDLTSIQVIERV